MCENIPPFNYAFSIYLVSCIFWQSQQKAHEEALQRYIEFQSAIYNIFVKHGKKAPTLDLGNIDFTEVIDASEIDKIPDGLRNCIRDFLRKTADAADVTIIVEVSEIDIVPILW